MGILNITPDSFSDGGKFHAFDAALKQAEIMHQEGADYLDIGGESTHPGAQPVSLQQELDRVLPVIEALHARIDVPISIDTRHAQVMHAAVAAGASFINDVNALRGENALETAAALKVPVCLMHMQGEPRTMQQNPQYDDVVQDIYTFFTDRINACLNAGIAREHLVLDPGFGFGKTFAHNVQLLAHLKQLTTLQLPILVGLSRKTWIGLATDKPPMQRLAGSLAAAILAVQQGAQILRVHDVGATKDALQIWHVVCKEQLHE